MEVCLDFETSIPVLPHMNLFLDLLCAFLNIDRPMPFAFEKEIGKSLKLGRGGIRDCVSVKKLLPCRRREMQGRVPKHLLLEHQREPGFCHVESGNPRSGPSRPWFYNQPIVV